ncbi:MAG: metallophosphoesterase [Myxococcota bacterium]
MTRRTLIVGDVHGCARELDRLLRKADADRIILVGDLFTKGPDPRGVWDLIREHTLEAVIGNHDVDTLNHWTPGKALPRKAFRWLRRLRPLIHEAGWSVAHAGVHPVRGARKTDAERAIYRKNFQGRPWWKSYRRRRLIVHGHDASRGLIDRRPYSLGLDTGCVRGGRLTGYLVGEDRLISVRARRDYC